MPGRRLTLSAWTRALGLAGLTLLPVAAGAAQMREFRFSVSGSGSATATSEYAAGDDALDKAKEQARLVCSGGNGRIDGRIERTGGSCLKRGGDDKPTYVCTAFVRAECVTRTR